MGKVEGGSGFLMDFPQRRNLLNAHGEHLKILALPMGISSLATHGPKALALGSCFHLSFPPLCSKSLQHEGAVCFCCPPLRAWSRHLGKALLLWGGGIFPDSSASGMILWDRMSPQKIDREIIILLLCLHC